MIADERFCQIKEITYEQSLNKWLRIKEILKHFIIKTPNADDYMFLILSTSKTCGFCEEFNCSASDKCPLGRCSYINSESQDNVFEITFKTYKETGNPYRAILYYIKEEKYKEALPYVQDAINIVKEFKKRGLVKEEEKHEN